MTDSERYIVVEEGEYSDFRYTILAVPKDLDLGAVLRAYQEEISPPRKPYTIHEIDLVTFICRRFGGRDVVEGEIHVIDDPVHYGCWQPGDHERKLAGWDNS